MWMILQIHHLQLTKFVNLDHVFIQGSHRLRLKSMNDLLIRVGRISSGSPSFFSRHQIDLLIQVRRISSSSIPIIWVSTLACCGNPGQGGAVSVGPIWHACIPLNIDTYNMERQYSCCGRRYIECTVWWAKDPIKLLHVRMKYLLRCELWVEWYDNSVMGSFAHPTVRCIYHRRAPCYLYSIVFSWYICMLEALAPVVPPSSLTTILSVTYATILNLVGIGEISK